MPRKVTLPEVLHQVYLWGGMEHTTEEERPLSYRSFKTVMLGSELLVSEKTIGQKYDQIVAAGYARNSKNSKIIILDILGIKRFLAEEHRIPFQGSTHTNTLKAQTQTAHTNGAHTHDEVDA